MVLALPAAAQGTLQESLLRAKPAVALVVSEVGGTVTVDCGGGRPIAVEATPFRETGTGWFVDPAGWLVTNAHVVAAAHERPRWLTPMLRDSAVTAACSRVLLERRGLRPGQRPDVEEEIARQIAVLAPRATVALTSTLSVILSNGQRLRATVVKFSPPIAGEAMSGRDLALLHVDAADMPTLALGDSARAKIGDRLHIIGFPNVVLSHELLNASARMEASVTSGAISGFKEDVNGRPVIQTDAAAAGGDSGGPAVSDAGDVLGVVTLASRSPGDQSAAVQGFNFVIPSAAVREFLNGTAVAAGVPARFNRAWAGALSAFFAGDHVRARPLLLEADRLLPGLPDVHRVMRENDERIANPPPRRFPWRAVGAGLSVVGALGCGLAWAHRWQRNRFRVAPREVARLLEDGEQAPVLLDVRDSETYRRSPVRIPRALHIAPERLASEPPPVETSRAVIAYCT